MSEVEGDEVEGAGVKGPKWGLCGGAKIEGPRCRDRRQGPGVEGADAEGPRGRWSAVEGAKAEANTEGAGVKGLRWGRG